ncbi:receptor-like protein EIX2 [Quercus robur]|uniref:receptor-like protein EIX2 n=1 Tax=Quercus robur TaxID=38942 RepID=UPI002162069B|nr:receptor-like protein EIX2 [Quercus robur]
MPKNIDEMLPNLRLLELASNFITGRIPPSIGMLKNLEILILRSNSLFGELPPHWEDLWSLNLLDEQFPLIWRNCTKLANLDLGGYKFYGNLPTWIGGSVSSLLRLSLRSNLFVGDIPQQLCLLSNLQILDLAQNDLSGAIPSCLGNMSKTDQITLSNVYEQMVVFTKGREYVYETTIYLVHSLDLSGNNLSGEIPDNITSLLKLGIVNLSMNHLTVKIPESIGNLRSMESLDLSRNQLFGPIPQSLSSLTFLSYLNLSFNNLSREIPSENQLQTINDPSIYEGNSLLSGPFLSTRCPGEDADPEAKPNGGGNIGADKNDEDRPESLSFYISIIAGFIFGFCGVCGAQLLKHHRGKLTFKSLII